jgi:hypothetical protein
MTRVGKETRNERPETFSRGYAYQPSVHFTHDRVITCAGSTNTPILRGNAYSGLASSWAVLRVGVSRFERQPDHHLLTLDSSLDLA